MIISSDTESVTSFAKISQFFHRLDSLSAGSPVPPGVRLSVAVGVAEVCVAASVVRAGREPVFTLMRPLSSQIKGTFLVGKNKNDLLILIVELLVVMESLHS